MERANLTSIGQKIVTDYRDNTIALVSDMSKVKEEMERKVVLVETYIAIIVLKGCGSICMEDKEFTIQAGDIFLCHPSNILEKSMMSMDFEIRGFFLSKELAENVMKEARLSWANRTTFSNYVIHAEQEEIKRLCMYYDLLNGKLNAPESTRKHLSLSGLFTALIYEFCDVFEHNGFLMGSANYTSAENIFQRFIKLLEDPHQPFVSVNEYAALLNITPKYFSSVCKKQSGKTANEIITDEIIKTAKILLRDNRLSIKQVADRLNFANQSHFGTYFRRHTGISPQQFRKL